MEWCLWPHGGGQTRATGHFQGCKGPFDAPQKHLAWPPSHPLAGLLPRLAAPSHTDTKPAPRLLCSVLATETQLPISRRGRDQPPPVTAPATRPLSTQTGRPWPPSSPGQSGWLGGLCGAGHILLKKEPGEPKRRPEGQGQWGHQTLLPQVKRQLPWLGDLPLRVSVQPLEMGGERVNTRDKEQGSLTYKERSGANKRTVSSGSFTARKNQVANNRKSMFSN